jgi:hypothetical protein
MLPGFRFLFAAIVLTTSILIFGLGAAALLRASHDQFASLPTLRPLPEPVYAQPYQPPAATLAMLRVEPTIVEKAPENLPPAAMIAPALEPAPEAVPVPPVETERLAALKIDEPAPPEAVKPEVAATTEPSAEATAPVEAAPVEARTPAAAEEIKVAAEATVAPSAPETVAEPTKVAALANPATAIGEPASAKPKSAQADKAAARKRLRAQRAKERRRLAAQRAQLLARQAAAQLQQQQGQSDPFTPLPTITPAPAARRR